MKKTSILDFFQCQTKFPKINCPACDTLVFKAKLNEHLDSFCCSSLNEENSNKNSNELKLMSSSSKNLQKSKHIPTTSNKLNLKSQRKKKPKNFIEKPIQESDDEIVIVKEISSPQSKSGCSRNGKQIECCNLNKDIEEKTYLPSLTSNEKSENLLGYPTIVSPVPKKRNLKTRRIKSPKANLIEKPQTSNDEIVFLQEISSPIGKSICSQNQENLENNLSKISVKNEKRNHSYTLQANEEKNNNLVFCEKPIKVPKKRKSSECVNENRTVKKRINLNNDASTEVMEKKSSSAEECESVNENKIEMKSTNSNNDTPLNEKESESVNENKIEMKSTNPNNDTSSKVSNGRESLNRECDFYDSLFESSKTKKKETLKLNSVEESVHSTKTVLTYETVAVKSEILPVAHSEIAENQKQICDYQNVFEDASAFSELSDNNETEEKKEKTYAPYYIANFKHILETVLSNEDNKILFNNEDMHYVNAFKSISDASQKMYVRLFQRKYKWLRIDKIKYPDITADSFATLEELAKAKLVDSGSCDIDLETAMNLLSLPEAKNLAKHFNFNSGKNKAEIKSMLIKHSKQHKSVFFMNGQNGIANAMLKKLRQIIGPCYRLSLLPKRLFTRILMLFNLPLLSEDDDDAAAGGQQQQLLTLLQINKGELSFPVYKQTKQTVIFIDRDELIRYEEARQLENDIFNAVEYKKFDKAKDLYIEAKEEYEDQCSKSFVNRASSLPVFLKRYTSFHVYIRCMTQGVEILQKLREYKEAVSLLRSLLKQKVFCQDYKGRWCDRLALNLEQHLKKPQKALEAIKEGLKDKNIRVGHRYSLLIRGLRITKSFDDEDEFKKQLLREADVIEAPKVHIKGRLCPRSILGRRNVFISTSSVCSDEDDVTILGVEQLAIEHYKGEGYIEGIHGEGATFISLYALLFWDIIYDGNVPDVFISPYQTHPLDLNSDEFFPNREKQILNYLETIKYATNEELKEIVKVCWENNHGKASLVSWDRFRDLEHAQSLVSCFGSCFLSGISERLARDFRFTRSGVPDLVVWNPESLKVKVVEVKGPGDKLSSKQILWLDYLIKLGVDAEVCLVEAEASKKLKK